MTIPAAVNDGQIQAVRAASQFLVNRLGERQIQRNDTLPTWIYSDGTVHITDTVFELQVSVMVGRGRQLVAVFNSWSSFAHDGSWQDHVLSLRLLLEMPTILTVTAPPFVYVQ